MRTLYTMIFLAIISFGFGQEIPNLKSSNLNGNSFTDTSVVFCYFNLYPGNTSVTMYEKVRLTYDSNGNEVLSENLDINGVTRSKRVSTYGVPDNLLTSTSYTLDTTSNQADFIYNLDSLFYDNNQLLTSEISYRANIYQPLKFHSVRDYSYDTNDLVVRDVLSVLDSATFHTVHSKTYYYNSSNLMTLYIDSSSQLNPYSSYVFKEEYSYDMLNRKSQLLKSVFYLGQFMPENKFEYYYRLTGELDATIYNRYYLTVPGHTWLSGKELYTYDLDGNTLSETNYSLNNNGQNYSYNKRILYYYDSEGHLISEDHETWEAGSQIWKYDCGRQLCNRVLGLKAEESIKVSVFPNPTNSMVNIQNVPYNSRVKVYNMLGSLMYESNILSESFQVDISQLGKKGIYLLYILDQDSKLVATKKVVLE